MGVAAADVRTVVVGPAPAVLYRPESQKMARALKVALGLPALDVAGVVERVDPNDLALETRAELSRHVTDLARVVGRDLTAREAALAPPSQSTSPKPERFNEVLRAPKASNHSTFPSVLKRWRVAEKSVVAWLNDQGWDLEDVSTQNLGYDATGTDASGSLVHLEIKKVDRIGGRFSMTTNEMSLMQSGVGRYLLAIVAGDEARARLLLLDPSQDGLARERVCRRWEWQFSD